MLKRLLDRFAATALPPRSFALAAGGLLRLESALGWRIVCRRGRLSIGVPGRRGCSGLDIELGADDDYVIGANHCILIEAAGLVEFDLITPLPSLMGGRRGTVRIVHPGKALPASAG